MRLALIMQDQSATTLDKYLCKLVEYILFYSQDDSLTLVELCKQIKEQFSLEFDMLEVETAISRKGRGRIALANKKYQLTLKSLEQLKRNNNDPNALLKAFILRFLQETQKDYDVNELFNSIQKYLYYSFNSCAENFLNLCQSKVLIHTENLEIPDHLVQQINEFISWENDEKNKLIYDIISFSYEYCMLTTKKNNFLTKNIFKGKRFFLDANIIFRMAGINQDERQFVIESFIKKCKEIEIELYYTSDTLSEVYRVIEGQIKYIKYLTQGQAPIDAELLQSIDSTNEINDFYVLYYNWCKESGNEHTDYKSFQNYLNSLVGEVFANLKLKNIPSEDVGKNRDTFSNLCSNLDNFKKEKRPRKPNSKESLRTDVNNISYILSLRNDTENQSIWQTNDYFVSADQLLTNWAKDQFSGVPVVVIPSTWLSIMLRFGGRSDDDYKAFCLFMRLRQHKSDSESIDINPVFLLNALSRRTSDQELKQQIVEEIINNKNEYVLNTQDDYPIAVENAFENILQKEKADVSTALAEKFMTYATEKKEEIDKLQDELKDKSTEEEHILKLANKKAEKAVEKWKNLLFLKAVLPAVFAIIMLLVTAVLLFKIKPFYDFLYNIASPTLKSVESDTSWNIYMWMVASFFSIAINYIVIKPIVYFSSDERKQILIKKYKKQIEKDLS